jgi:hypothetical protein
MKVEPIQCSETSAYNIQTSGNYPEDNILHNIIRGILCFADRAYWHKSCKYPK